MSSRRPRSSDCTASAIQPSMARQTSADWPSASCTPSAAQPFAERRRRGRAPGVDKAAVGVQRDEPLGQGAVPDADAVDGQRVEDLVREHDTRERAVLARRRDAVREAGRGQPLAERLEAPRIDLDGHVPEHGEQLRPRPLEPAQDGLGQGPGAGSVLADDERGGAIQAFPDLDQLIGQRLPEDRVRLGRCQEVAAPARSRLGSAVVAAIRVVQGELHEARERHRAVGRDLRTDPGSQGLVLADLLEVDRRLASQAGAQVHRLVRSRRRRPGPTSVCPPRATGIRAAGG